jgi:hypothetical protein
MELLSTATPDGKKLASTLGQLVNLKDTAHYGASLISPGIAVRAVRWATILVAPARDEVER